MGYSSNPNIVEQRMGLLLELKAGRACRWKTTPDMAHTNRLKARIHEALYIASQHPDRFPELAIAARNFALYTIEPGVIEAKPKYIPQVSTDSSLSTPTQGTAPFGREVSTVAKTSAQDLIDAWNAHTPSQDPVNFQQTTLDESELEKLYKWTSEHEPRLMILVGPGFITLALEEIGAATYSWQPKNPQPQIVEKRYDI